MPNTVTTIAQSAFANSTPLTEINIPDNLTYIGRMAFFNCKLSIPIPNSVTYIGDEAFKTINDNIINIIFDPEKMKASGATWDAKEVNGVKL